MGRRDREELEKILDHSSRTSTKWWTNNLVLVKEALRTGKLIDGTDMTEEDRSQFELFETFIVDNLRWIRERIEGLDEFGDIATKAILGYISELPDMGAISTKAGEVVKIKNMEEREREKWK